MPPFFRLIGLVGLLGSIVCVSTSVDAAGTPSQKPLPSWLAAHVGKGDGEIAPIVLGRARALYLAKTSEGKVKNSCYFAMDCDPPKRLIRRRVRRPLLHRLRGRADFPCYVLRSWKRAQSPWCWWTFSNGRQCARNFGNAMDSNLTTGGAYLTSEIKTSFKGYYRAASGKKATLIRSFVQLADWAILPTPGKGDRWPSRFPCFRYLHA